MDKIISIKDMRDRMRYKISEIQRFNGLPVTGELDDLTIANIQDTKRKQYELKSEGRYKGKIDGIFGPRTKQALETPPYDGFIKKYDIEKEYEKSINTPDIKRRILRDYTAMDRRGTYDRDKVS